MPRHVYRESDRIGGFVTLLGKRVTDYNPDIIVPGEWVAECAGPSHPNLVREFCLSTRDIYYSRPRAFGCPSCQQAALDWLKDSGFLPVHDEPAPMRYTRPPAPVQGLVIGRLYIDEWTPKVGWICACLCGCKQYETVRTTQFVASTAIRPCPVSGRLRPAVGTVIAYRDGGKTEIANASQDS